LPCTPRRQRWRAPTPAGLGVEHVPRAVGVARNHVGGGRGEGDVAAVSEIVGATIRLALSVPWLRSPLLPVRLTRVFTPLVASWTKMSQGRSRHRRRGSMQRSRTPSRLPSSGQRRPRAAHARPAEVNADERVGARGQVAPDHVGSCWCHHARRQVLLAAAENATTLPSPDRVGS